MNTILYNKMSYTEKSLKAPLLALLSFIMINFGLFYIINISFSWETLFIKVLLLLLYFILLLKVFKVPMRDLLTIIRRK